MANKYGINAVIKAGIDKGLLEAIDIKTGLPVSSEQATADAATSATERRAVNPEQALKNLVVVAHRAQKAGLLDLGEAVAVAGCIETLGKALNVQPEPLEPAPANE